MGRPEKSTKGRNPSKKDDLAEKAESFPKSRNSKAKFNFSGEMNEKEDANKARKSQRNQQRIKRHLRDLKKMLKILQKRFHHQQM